MSNTYELKFLRIFFYTICLVGGVGTGIAYWFCRKKDTSDIKLFAEKIEEYIRNFDDIEEEE